MNKKEFYGMIDKWNKHGFEPTATRFIICTEARTILMKYKDIIGPFDDKDLVGVYSQITADYFNLDDSTETEEYPLKSNLTYHYFKIKGQIRDVILNG